MSDTSFKSNIPSEIGRNMPPGLAMKCRAILQKAWDYLNREPSLQQEVKEALDILARYQPPAPPPREPCGHPGCMSHVSHPCEGCGQGGPPVERMNISLHLPPKGPEEISRQGDTRMVKQGSDVWLEKTPK